MTGQGSFWFGSSDFYPETVNQSLRFNEGDTPYLSRTFVTPSSTRKIIIATWIKPSELGDETPIMYSSSSNTQNYFLMGFAADGYISATDNFNLFTVEGNTTRFAFRTERLFRDPSAWMHVCVAIDTTQATDTDRVVIFFNGKRYTGGYSSYNTQPSENRDFTILNSAIEHRIGAYSNANHAYGNLDGYLSEFYFIDGQSIFSDTSATINSTFLADANTLATFCEQKNGVAIPKKYSGTFGNNGCRLTFEATGTGTTSQGTTAQTNIGDDQSGQGHNFSVNGLATVDVVKDSPTNNFCVLNPLGKQSSGAVSEGGLKAVITSGGNSGRIPGTFAVNSGKWYWEVRQSSSNRFGMGVFDTDRYVMANEDLGSDAYEWGFITSDNAGNGAKRNSGTIVNGYGGDTSDGHVVMVALDVDNEAIWFGKQGSWFNTDGSSDSATVKGQIEAGTTTNAAYTGVSGNLTPSFVRQTSNNTLHVNFGQDDTFAGNETTAGNTDSNGNGSFQYEPPSGFLALCSSNLPDTTLSPNQTENVSDYFNTVLYTGNGSTNAITGVGFQPDWVWSKRRNASASHNFWDSSRGTTKLIFPDAGSVTEKTVSGLTSFDSDGFTMGSEVTYSSNINSSTYVAWCWKINGGTTSTNTEGSLSCTVQASTEAGISIVTWAGDGNTSVTLGHGLEKKPELIIYMGLDNTYEHPTWYKTFGTSTGSFISTSNQPGAFARVQSEPTDTLIPNASKDYTNVSGEDNIAYVFHSVDGFSKISQYTGNGSTDGTFVYTGFRPAWVMTKKTSGSGNWYINDTGRYPSNLTGGHLYADLSNAESGTGIDILSNGFKIRNTDSSQNSSGGTYLYMAFAEQPFKFSNAR